MLVSLWDYVHIFTVRPELLSHQLDVKLLYGHFTISSPDWTLGLHKNPDGVQHVRLRPYQCCNHVSDCSVQPGLDIVK